MTRPTPGQRFTTRIVNPVVRAVLGSPAHGLLSRHLVVLRLRGRRTGRAFSLPVGYVRDGDELVVTVGAPGRKRWWRNVDAAGTPVEVVLRGARREGVARQVVGPEGDVSVRVRLAG